MWHVNEEGFSNQEDVGVLKQLLRTTLLEEGGAGVQNKKRKKIKIESEETVGMKPKKVKKETVKKEVTPRKIKEENGANTNITKRRTSARKKVKKEKH